MPAPIAASEAVTAMLTTMVTHRYGASAKSTSSPDAIVGDHGEEPDDPSRVLDDQLAADAGADDEADDLGRLGGGRHPAALHHVEAELLLVEQRCERGEPDQRGGEERQRVEDPAQALDLPHRAPALGERRRRLLGEQGVGDAHGRAFLDAAARLPQPAAEQDQDRDRYGQDDERGPPAEPRREQPGQDRPEEGCRPRSSRSRSCRPAAATRSDTSRRSASCGSGRRWPARSRRRPASARATRPRTPGRCRRRSRRSTRRRAASAGPGCAGRPRRRSGPAARDRPPPRPRPPRGCRRWTCGRRRGCWAAGCRTRWSSSASPC